MQKFIDNIRTAFEYVGCVELLVKPKSELRVELNLFDYLSFRNCPILAEQYNLTGVAFYEAKDNFLFTVLKMACQDNEVFHSRVRNIQNSPDAWCFSQYIQMSFNEYLKKLNQHTPLNWNRNGIR